jgi:hypothetical protein
MSEIEFITDDEGDEIATGEPVPSPEQAIGQPDDVAEEYQRGDFGDPAFDEEPEVDLTPEGEDADDTDPEDDEDAPEED